MSFAETFRDAIDSLTAHKLRAGLSMLGMIFGVGAVIAMLSIGEGAERQALDATALDRVHAAMVLQASGHANALRALIAAEQDRGPDFLRLANALSALYPRGSHEKRLLDAMLLAVPR